MKKIVFSAALAVTLSSPAYSQSTLPDSAPASLLESQMRLAARDVVFAWMNNGSFGVVDRVSSCYKKSVKQVYYCTFIDLGGMYVDAKLSQSGAIPANDYFTTSWINMRIDRIFESSQRDESEFKTYINAIQTIIAESIKIEASTYKTWGGTFKPRQFY